MVVRVCLFSEAGQRGKMAGYATAMGELSHLPHLLFK